MKTTKMGNYELTVNRFGEVVKIMQQKPYQRVYPYKHIGRNQWTIQEYVNVNTLKSGLRNGNWRLQ